MLLECVEAVSRVTRLASVFCGRESGEVLLECGESEGVLASVFRLM